LIIRVCLLYLLALPLTLTASPISLWRVDHCAATVYLLGSIHAVKPNFYPLPAVIDSAFETADKVVFEVDLQRVNDASIRQLISDMGMYPPDQQLENQLSAATLRLLRKYLQKSAQNDTVLSPLTFSAVQQMRPWYLSLVLGMRELQTVGYQPALGIDRHYFDRARQQKKPTGMLETAEAQILLLAADSPAGQDLSLRATLKDVDNLEVQLEQVIKAWQLGDVDLMLNQSLAASKDDPLLDRQFKRLINDRNVQMLEHIRGYLTLNKTTMVIVGALHLGGAQGLLNMLRQDHMVTQIDTNSSIDNQPITVDTATHRCNASPTTQTP
jgi:uncharacterized protein YbaP (TraB family)